MAEEQPIKNCRWSRTRPTTIRSGSASGPSRSATSRGAPARPSIGALAEYSGTGDFNGDGIPDIVASNAGGAAQLHVLTGNGNGTFTAMAGSPFALSTAGRVLSVNDFNNDGIADISVACQGDGVVQAAVHVFLGG